MANRCLKNPLFDMKTLQNVFKCFFKPAEWRLKNIRPIESKDASY